MYIQEGTDIFNIGIIHHLFGFLDCIVICVLMFSFETACLQMCSTVCKLNATICKTYATFCKAIATLGKSYAIFVQSACNFVKKRLKTHSYSAQLGL